MEKYKVKIEIIDDNNIVLGTSIIDSDIIKTSKQLFNVDCIVDVYNQLLFEIERQSEL